MLKKKMTVLLAVVAISSLGCDKDVKKDNIGQVSDELKINKNEQKESDTVPLEDGEYQLNVTLTGGSGRATVESPAKVVVENGKYTATIIWSSKNYDYMIVNDKKYMNEAPVGEASTFTFPIEINKDIDVIGDTTAMSVPHEVEYTLYFSE